MHKPINRLTSFGCPFFRKETDTYNILFLCVTPAKNMYISFSCLLLTGKRSSSQIGGMYTLLSNRTFSFIFF
uniref:Ovule protein n=1 Tax=Strongyloides venezuelensis TaxID=75913 RepID=A0A0K0G1T4_STRVS